VQKVGMVEETMERWWLWSQGGGHCYINAQVKLRSLKYLTKKSYFVAYQIICVVLKIMVVVCMQIKPAKFP
jgi:hypothetical protein